MQSTSPCIDAGTGTDQDGTTADIGAIYYNQNYYGCTNPNSCNYNSNSIQDDGSCEFLDCNNECGGPAQLDLDNNCILWSILIPDNYSIFDINGRLIESRIIVNENDLLIDVRDFKKGLYFIKLVSNEASNTLKFVIQ